MSLTEAEYAEFTDAAAKAGVSVPRLLVESAKSEGQVEAGRAHAVMGLLEVDEQVRRERNNLNQLTRYAHQHKDAPAFPEELVARLLDALHASTRASLGLESAARWVMGLNPATTATSVDVDEDLALGSEWAEADHAGR
ncbi:plasmid mobilization relaxosome protein MobC [Nocardia jinanensis]|uniref:Bacterial mobilisation domain-containing protein n=1 Tax=Nocardia jinanensis TaxID=382504 RepID=A0A917VZN8_9NOCA|nr:plasmid mobilization relaxosome protein MobC [Nocardia jinanensis]GGL44105.1 hypothetical protein GCM10011588_68530 [Nocardia jinanensis]